MARTGAAKARTNGGKGQASAAKPQGNAARTQDVGNELTIDANGNYSPSTGISINNGGVAKFSVTYPSGMDVCNIPIGPITFSSSGKKSEMKPGTGGTVKIGS
jgi:hypothetical protein